MRIHATSGSYGAALPLHTDVNPGTATRSGRSRLLASVGGVVTNGLHLDEEQIGLSFKGGHCATDVIESPPVASPGRKALAISISAAPAYLHGGGILPKGAFIPRGSLPRAAMLLESGVEVRLAHTE